MKIPFSIIAAAAAAIAGILARFADQMGMGPPGPPKDPDAASEIPPLTPKRVEQYALVGGTDSEIADRFLVDESRLKKDHADVLRSARGLRRLSLRSYEFELAKKLNGPMLTWLGRNELGQRNQPSDRDDSEPEFQ